MGSSDPILKMLKDFSYNVVRLPRTNIRPLQILEKRGNDLVPLGELTDLFVAGSASPPTVGPDEQAGFINGQRTRDLDLSVGLTLLGGIIGAMTGTQAKVNAGYKKASAVSFEFDDVKMNQTNQIALNKFLVAAKPDLAAGAGLLKALNEDRLFIITNTIKSSKFTTEAKQSNGTSVGVDVPIIQAAVGGSVGIKTGGTDNSKVTYSGAVPLIFGFQAAQLDFEQGRFLSLKQISPDAAALRKPLPGQPPAKLNLKLLETSGPFVNLKDDGQAGAAKKRAAKPAAKGGAKKGAAKKAAPKPAKQAAKQTAKKATTKTAKKPAKKAAKKSAR